MKQCPLNFRNNAQAKALADERHAVLIQPDKSKAENSPTQPWENERSRAGLRCRQTGNQLAGSQKGVITCQLVTLGTIMCWNHANAS